MKYKSYSEKNVLSYHSSDFFIKRGFFQNYTLTSEIIFRQETVKISLTDLISIIVPQANHYSLVLFYTGGAGPLHPLTDSGWRA